MRIKLCYPLTSKEIADYLNLPAPKIDNIVSYVSTDTRNLSKGDLFIALKGSKYDGESFVSKAKEIGALTVSKNNVSADFQVADTEAAFLALSKGYKDNKLLKLKCTVAITGSVGKTTTKEILKTILSKKFKTHATKDNFNNSVGLPFTVLSAPDDTEILICELGMNHKGEIEKLAKAISADIAIITNIGTAHIENLGTREKIAEAKLELMMCDKKPFLIAPIEEALLRNRANLLFSVDRPSDACVKIKKSNVSGSIIDVITNKRTLQNIETGIYGEHYLSSLAASIAVAELLGFCDSEIISSLLTLDNTLLRQKIITIGGIHIYDDTYSSSPEAALAMLEHVSLLGYTQKSCVLGDMLELGERTEQAHRDIGRHAAQLGYKRIYAFGNYSHFICVGAKSLKQGKVEIFKNPDINAPQITANQIKESYDGGIILFKASHALHAERIYEYLKE